MSDANIIFCRGVYLGTSVKVYWEIIQTTLVKGITKDTCDVGNFFILKFYQLFGKTLVTDDSISNFERINNSDLIINTFNRKKTSYHFIINSFTNE